MLTVKYYTRCIITMTSHPD